MKKLTKLLALIMTGGMLMVGCGEVDEELPDVEETEENIDEGLNDVEEGVEDTGNEIDEELDEETE
ncbi:hypothetical protein AB4027_10080 [Alkalibacterium putridalgicola]|uniref:hypothetical protein n=1 Tax=Alkalibacterium putridalgicola TaxID=426703 RepID=UPI0034CDB17D